MHITSSLLICYTTYGTGTIAIGNEIHLFCSLSVPLYIVINSILLFMKYVGVSLLINTCKHAKETRVKLYTHLINYI